MKRLALAATIALAALGCAKDPEPSTGPTVPSVPASDLPGHGSLKQDDTTKESARLLPAEVYIRAFLDVFGTLSPLEAEELARSGSSALFDRWRDYLASLGLPDYEKDIARPGSTNAMMLATFERIGAALCERAIERDLRAKPRPAVEKRAVFAFEPTTAEPTAPEFAERFDVLHRTLLGYPAGLAPTERTARFFALYQGVVARHSAKDAPKSNFTPSEAGWAAVCHGLVRHPEFVTY